MILYFHNCGIFIDFIKCVLPSPKLHNLKDIIARFLFIRINYKLLKLQFYLPWTALSRRSSWIFHSMDCFRPPLPTSSVLFLFVSADRKNFEAYGCSSVVKLGLKFQ